MEFSDVFGAETILDLAGPQVYLRGAAYRAGGRVEIGKQSDQRLEVKVRGTVPYAVVLWAESDKPRWSCSCPYAEDGLFCKHCVAVALTLVSKDAIDNPFVSDPTESSPKVDLVAHLDGLSRERLVEIVLEQSEIDWALRERLDAEAKAVRGEGLDLASWRRRIDDVFSPYGDFVDYREASGWASDIFDVLDNVEMLVDVGHSDAVIELTEYAHRCTESAIEYVDDSDGSITGIEERLFDLHLAACEIVRPDPVDLARRLTELELTSELDGFHRAAAAYAHVLGETGIEEYRRILAPKWEGVKAAKEEFSSDRFRVEQAMIGVALAGGEPDELIEVLKEGTLYPHDYVEIARSLADAGRTDEAIDWARSGLTEWPSRPEQLSDLRGLLADLLRERGDSGEAVELFFEGFKLAPSLSSYRDLLSQAGPDTDEWAGRCVDLLRVRMLEEPSEDQDVRPWFIPRSAQSLVEILMYEGDVEEAWTVATDYGVSDSTWSSLARAREATEPLDSITVYQRDVESLINHKKRRAYESAVRLLLRIETLAERAGEPEVFSALVQSIRSEHKPKWSLMEMLDREGW